MAPRLCSSFLKLLSCTALVGAAMGPSSAAFAACTSYAPAGSATVACTGTTNTAIVAPGSTFVTVGLDTNATLSTATTAINLGNDATINFGAGSSVTSAGGPAISLTRGTINLDAGSAVTNGIAFTGAGTGTVNILGSVDSITANASTALNVGLGDTGSIGSAAGNTIFDTFSLFGTGTGTFDTNRFTTNVTGFDLYAKYSSGTWTLTGANKRDWYLFGGTLVGTTDNIGGLVSSAAGTVLRFNQASSATYSDVITGDAAVEVQGGGTITVQNAQTYTGGLTVSGAGSRVVASADDRLGSGTVTLANGGAVQIDFLGNSTRSYVLSGGDGIIDPSANSSSNGTISGSGRLVISGPGTLNLNGNNTYSGGTLIDGATVNILANTPLGNAAGDISLTNGATLGLQASFNTARNINLSAGTQTISSPFTNNSLTGTISGAGQLAVSGASSVLTLSGNNTYTGGTTIAGPNAYVLINSDANLGNSSGTVTISSGGGLRLGSDLNTSRDFIINAGGASIDTQTTNSILFGNISGNGRLTKRGSGSLTLAGGSSLNAYTILAGTLVGNVWNITSDVANSGVLRFDQSGAGTYGNIISGTGSVEIRGSGNVTMSGVNTYTGGTSIDGATLTVSADNNLGGAGSLTIANGGTLNMSTAFNSARAVNLTGGDATITTPAASSTTLSGIISGSGRLVKTGQGVLILTNNGNTFNGIKVDGANNAIRVNTDARMGNLSGGIELSNGGSLQLGGAITTNRNINLSGGDGIVTNLGFNTVLNGTISGSGRFVRSGNSLMTLGGTNTYTGGTYIDSLSALRVMSDSALGAAVSDVEMRTGYLQFGSSFTTARDFTTSVFAGYGAYFDTQAFNNTISGNLAGTGLIYKAGSGTLTLTGTNSNTNGFDIQAGTLSGNAGNLTGDIANSGTLFFDQGPDATYSHIISGTGNFIKSGMGNLILTNTHTYTGTTTIEDGRLAVNGSIASSAFIVNGAGNLGGSGTIGTLSMTGLLTPGNSIGTLHAGNTVFNTGAIYEVEIDDLLNSDLLDITGTLDINPGVSVSIFEAPGTYTDGSLYTIITHSGARTGTFDSITDNLAFLTASLIYNPNDVQVLLSANSVPFSNVGKDQVQYDTAEALEDLGAGNELYDAFIGLTVTDAQNALDTVSGEHIPGVTGAMAQTTGIIRNALTTRMQAITYNRGGALSAALAPAAGNDGGMFSEYTAAFVEPAAGNAQLRDGSSRIWMEAFGTSGQSAAQGTSAKQDRGSAGILAGADAELDGGTYIGIFGGFEQGEVNTYAERASSAISNYHGGLYAMHQFEPIRLSAGLGGTYHMIETKRYVVFPGFTQSPESDTNGYTATGFIEASHPFEMNDDWAIEPFAGVSVTYSHMDGYAEKNGGAANLTVESVDALTPTQTIGLRFGKTLTGEDGAAYHMSGSLGWQHSYGDLDDKATMRFSSGTTQFTTNGPGRTRDAAVVGVGLDAKIEGSLNAYGGYNGTLSPEAQDHALSAGIKLSF